MEIECEFAHLSCRARVTTSDKGGQEMKQLAIAGWAVTIAIVLFMIQDVTPDLQQAPWAIKANAELGIPANIVLLIGISGLVSAVAYLVPQTSMLGAILLTGFLGGAVVIHLRVNGDPADIAENIVIGVLTWAGLWMRDSRVRALLPFRFASSSDEARAAQP
jgi:hypothetical protein